MADKPRKRKEPLYQRTDNGLKLTTFRAVAPINHKNYYTSYLKKDSQLLVNFNDSSSQNGSGPASAGSGGAAGERETTREATPRLDDDDITQGSKTVVIHLGSRNLRIGLATDAMPKKIPMAIARKRTTKQEDTDMSDAADADQEEYRTILERVTADFKERMKFYKRRIVANGEETCTAFNTRQKGEDINDADELEVPDADEVFGHEILDLDESFDVLWPLAAGQFNEAIYASPQLLFMDIVRILKHAITAELGVPEKDLDGYAAMLLIPDLYERTYVTELVELLFSDLRFSKLALLQESVAATFGAGISSACIVDVGAQTAKVSCVDDGMCISDSRINLKYGGDDITRIMIKMLRAHAFPYHEMDLNRQYDWSLAEWLKAKYCTTVDADIAVQLYSFYRKKPETKTRKYEFKIYEEAILPVLGLMYPDLFDHAGKLDSHYRLIPRPENPYDGKYLNPVSDGMINIAHNTLSVFGESYETKLLDLAAQDDREETEKPEDENDKDDKEESIGPESTIASSVNSPSRSGTPVPETAQAKAAAQKAIAKEKVKTQLELAEAVDPTKVLLAPLDHAIVESIEQAAAKSSAGATAQTFYENIMVIGGGAKFAGFHLLLTDRLGMWNHHANKTVGEIAVMPVPREVDPEFVSWKGGSVYSKLKIIDEMWVTPSDWGVLGSRVLQYKALFNF